MHAFVCKGKQISVACAVLSICAVTAVYAAMDPSFELDPKLLFDSAHAPAVSAKKPLKSSKTRTETYKSASVSDVREYTVRAGDNLFKILMHDFGLTNAEAEACINEILRVNNISNIRALKVGQKIIVPQKPARKLKEAHSSPRMKARGPQDYSRAESSQALRLVAPILSDTDPETIRQVKSLWNKLVPQPVASQKPLSFQSAAFSLTLDPDRYPVLYALDGSRIVVDQNDAIPSLVKSLIAEQEPSVRIVSGGPVNSRRFLSSLLGSAGFYSVEENFSLEYGADPKLKVTADFKIEKTSESLINQDVILLNSSNSPFPHPLTAFLKKEGFSAVEPFASTAASTRRPALGAVRQISAVSGPEIVDALLKALNVRAVKERQVDVFAADNNGISLSVKAERYFERDGKPFVIAGFDGNPVTYTLFRILETKGYRVVILDLKDDFRKVTEKILASLQVSGDFARHMMVPENDSNYSLEISGFRLKGPGVPGGALFLTNKPLDRITYDLLTESGYDVLVK